MPIGEITIQSIYEAAECNHPDLACEILMEKGGIRDGTLFELLVNEELWVNTNSRPRRMQMLLEWLLCEFVSADVREPTEIKLHGSRGAAQAGLEARWSLALKDETRKALLDPPLARVSDGKLPMKNVNGSFGHTSVVDLMKACFTIIGKKGSETRTYESR